MEGAVSPVLAEIKVFPASPAGVRVRVALGAANHVAGFAELRGDLALLQRAGSQPAHESAAPAGERIEGRLHA